MKRITSFVIVLLLSMVAVFAVPKPIQTKTLEDEVLTYWEITETYAIITSNTPIEDQFEYGFDKKSTVEITNPDIVYLIAKYGYIIEFSTDCDYYSLYTEIDGEYKKFVFYYDEGDE